MISDERLEKCRNLIPVLKDFEKLATVHYRHFAKIAIESGGIAIEELLDEITALRKVAEAATKYIDDPDSLKYERLRKVVKALQNKFGGEDE